MHGVTRDYRRRTRKLAGYVFVGNLLGLACPNVAHATDAGVMNVWQGDEQLATNKRAIVSACQQLGASDEFTQLVVAMAMQETTMCCAEQRDCSKNGTSSENLSCFNMNVDYLTQLGWHAGGTDLNRNENVVHAVGYLLAGFRQWGVDKTLAFHRGGRAAFEDGVSYGAQEYIARMKSVARYLSCNPEHLTDNWRVGYDTPHV